MSRTMAQPARSVRGISPGRMARHLARRAARRHNRTMPRTHTTVPSVLGEITLVADDGFLAGVYVDGQAHRPHPDALGAPVAADDVPVLASAARQLAEYFAGRRRAFDLPLAPATGDLEGVVREAILDVPFGSTTTYGTLAEDLGDARLAQAVGQAVGRNPYLVVVPCHRVLGATGALTGYAGGVDRKAYLLDLEQHAEGLTMLPPTAPAIWARQEPPAERRPQEVEGVVEPGALTEPPAPEDLDAVEVTGEDLGEDADTADDDGRSA